MPVGGRGARCFAPLPEHAPGFSGCRGRGLREAALLDAAAGCLRAIEGRAARWGVYQGLQGGSVYVGVAGVALVKLRAARLLNRAPEAFSGAKLVRPGSQWAGWSPETFAREALGSLAEAEELLASNGEASCCSFFCGLSGILALQAEAWDLLGDAEATGRTLEALVKHSRLALRLPREDCELLYGRCGCLWALLSVQNLWGAVGGLSRPGASKGNFLKNKEELAAVDVRKLVAELANQVFEEGRRLGAASTLPLLYRWRGKPYLGAAHGLVGVLNTLLYLPSDCCEVSDRSNDVMRTIHGLIDLRLPSGNLPSSLGNNSDRLVAWCHGPAGLIHLLVHPGLKALGGSPRRFLDAAIKAGQVVWERGLLKKGLGLCHGISGNAYSFLALYRHTGDPGHLRRAEQFAAVAADSVTAAFDPASELSASAISQLTDRPDRPASLMEGIGGACCLFLDLIDPAKAAFPGFELPPAGLTGWPEH